MEKKSEDISTIEEASTLLGIVAELCAGFEFYFMQNKALRIERGVFYSNKVGKIELEVGELNYLS